MNSSLKILLSVITGFILIFSIVTLNRKNETLYVSPVGNDTFEGTKLKPYRTIQHAVNAAKPGTVINILPGTYREAVVIKNSGTTSEPVRLYVNPDDRNKAVIAGSQPSSDFRWDKCTRRLCPGLADKAINRTFVTGLDWQETPFIIYEIDKKGNESQLHLARTPDFVNPVNGHYHNDWWTAYNSPESVSEINDPAHLADLSGLEGATAYMMDGASRCGNALYVRNIDTFNKNWGSIAFSKPVGFSLFGSQEKGIGPGTKYYFEGKIQFLDSPGEWYYDGKNKKLYLWPEEEDNPASLHLEIGKRPLGIGISGASHIMIDGLTFKYINTGSQANSGFFGAISLKPDKNENINDITLDHLNISHSSEGIALEADNNNSKISNINIESIRENDILKDSIIAIASKDSPSNINNLTVKNSEFSNTSYYFNDIGINLIRVSNTGFLNNYIHDTSNYGIHISGFERDKGEVKNIRVENNIIRNACENHSGCAGLKFYGGKFENTVARANIITGNTGWSFCQATKYGTGFAHGIFISNASGIVAENNVTASNTGDGIAVYPRQIEARDNRVNNNLIVNNNIGLDLQNPRGVSDYNPHAYSTRHDNTSVVSNLFLKNKTGIQADPANPGKLIIDYNAYVDNKTDMIFRNLALAKSSDIAGNIYYWENHSTDPDISKVINPGSNNLILTYFSPLRGRGAPMSKNPWINGNLYFLGIANDIGPCKFNWLGASCPSFLPPKGSGN